MFLSYFDECGDDGCPPAFSSELFILTGVYFHFTQWKPLFEEFKAFRTEMKKIHSFPVSLEFHTRDFIRNKYPYINNQWSNSSRKMILSDMCRMIGSMDIKIINSVINKQKITKPIDILDTAFTFSLQRIENDLAKREKKEECEYKFMILTDEGRIQPMRRIARKIQRFNFIPSKYGRESRNIPLQRLIEDPLPKTSRKSYFIQMCDTVSTIVHYYLLETLGIGKLPNRIVANGLDQGFFHEMMEVLKPSFNLHACSTNEYGIKIYPE